MSATRSVKWETCLRPGCGLFLSLCLVFASVAQGFAYQTDPSLSQQLPQAAEQSLEQLQQLVAPIAVYPDSLIAQILPAATYPHEVVEAEQWIEQHKDLTGGQRAQRAGNLKTTAEQTVTTQGQTIVIQPATTDVVYVPQYDPWLAYGAPLAVFPGWYPYPGLFLDTPGVFFGLGFAVRPFYGFGWGWRNWAFDWHRGGRVVFNHNTYISRSTTIVNRNNFRSNRFNFRGADSHGRGFAGHQTFHSPTTPHIPEGTHSGAFGGFGHGGFARGNSSRGQSSVGGFHGGGRR